MDRFEWSDGSLQPGETLVESQSGVGLYNGNEKVRKHSDGDGMTHYFW